MEVPENKEKVRSKYRQETWDLEYERTDYRLDDPNLRPCFSCLKPVTFEGFEASHVISKYCGGMKIPFNLRVSCRSCNGTSIEHSYLRVIEQQSPGITHLLWSDLHTIVGLFLFKVREYYLQRNIDIDLNQSIGTLFYQIETNAKFSVPTIVKYFINTKLWMCGNKFIDYDDLYNIACKIQLTSGLTFEFYN